MLCTTCSQLIIKNTNKKCGKCNGPVYQNISVLCDNCSISNKTCASCLKKMYTYINKNVPACPSCGKKSK